MHVRIGFSISLASMTMHGACFVNGLIGLEVELVPLEFWVAVKELKLSYYIGETLLFTIHTHYGNLI